MTEKVNSTGFFGSSFFSSVSTSVNALSQTIQQKGIPEMNKRFNEFQQKARELPTQLAQMPLDLESERKTFLKNNTENHVKPKGSESVTPWAGYDGYEKEMKSAIMEISKDRRNFLISPPEDTNFQFDINAYSQNAQAALKQDEELSKMRFLLVPQHVTEPAFWRNYFYRVTLVKQTVLSEPPAPKEKEDDVLFDFKDDDDEQDDDDNDDEQDENMEDSKEDNIKKNAPAAQTVTPSKQQDDDDDDGMEEWERELRRQAL